MGEIIVRPKPPVPMPFTGERLTSDYGGQTQIEHLHRYLLAREWCRGKDVLDVASGEGYGTALLAQIANSATGVELAQDAVDHAGASYTAPNLRYIAGDARKLPAPDAAFDVVVSFETIEHFAEQELFLQEIRRVLRPGGLLIVSTPDRDNYSPAETPANPYHVQEMTAAEFSALLQGHFANVSVLLQRPMYGSVLMPASGGTAVPICFERRGDVHFEGSPGLSRPQYVLAFASDQPIAALPPSVYIETGRLGLLSPPEAEARFLAAENALAASRAEQHHELEALRDQLAQSRELSAQVETYASADQDRTQEIDALHAELAGLRGEVKGLLVANGMAERAFAALGDRVEEALRKTAAGEILTTVAPRASGGPARGLEAKLASARAEANAAVTLVRRMELSTSWRLTAPLRAISRRVLRRS